MELRLVPVALVAPVVLVESLVDPMVELLLLGEVLAVELLVSGEDERVESVDDELLGDVVLAVLEE